MLLLRKTFQGRPIEGTLAITLFLKVMLFICLLYWLFIVASRGHSLAAVRGLLSRGGFSGFRAQAQGHVGSAVAAPGL